MSKLGDIIFNIELKREKYEITYIRSRYFECLYYSRIQSILIDFKRCICMHNVSKLINIGYR